MAGTYAPSAVFTGLDNNGNPIASGLLFTYEAGTSTKLATYTDVDLSSANTNPIVLDSAGRATIFLLAQSYKFVLAPASDTDPPANPIWTRDDIAAVPSTNIDLDITGTAGEALTANDCLYISAGDGGRTAGRWYKTDADNDYSSTTAKSIGFAVNDIASGAEGSIRIQGRITDLSGLVAGTTYYISATAGAVTSSAPANARAVLVADSTTSGVLSFWLSIQDASATTAGIVNLTTQTLGAGTKTVDALTVTGQTTLSSTTTQTGLATFTVPPLGAVKYARQTADVTKNNNTTLADLTGLSFAVGANEAWAVRYDLIGNSTAVADYKFTLTGPSAPTAVWFAGVTGQASGSGTYAAAFSSTITIPAGGAQGSLSIVGLIRNGANAGTVQIQFAQANAEVSDSTIYTESYLIAHRVA